MIFKEIELSEALRIIDEKKYNLYFIKGGPFEDLKNFSNYSISDKEIRSSKWFLRLEGDTE